MREYMALVDRHNAALERADYRAGLICAVLANINRDPKRRSQPYEPADFMPRKVVPQPAQAAPHEELDDILALGAALGAMVVIHDD